jgi:hypothetical protein
VVVHRPAWEGASGETRCMPIRPATVCRRIDFLGLRERGVGASQAGVESLPDTTLKGRWVSRPSRPAGMSPTLDRDDLVAIEQVGACGASFTSRYNGRPAPAEVLLWLDGSLKQCERPPPPSSLSLPHASLTAQRGRSGRGLATPWIPPRSRRSPCHEHLKTPSS